MKSRIAIVGGSSQAHALAAAIGADPANEIRLLTRRPHRWGRVVTAYHPSGVQVSGGLECVSDRPEEVLDGAEIVFVCVPLPYREEALRALRPFLDPRTWVGGVPGFGGFDWQARRVLGPEARLFGFQRVPFVRRTISYGEAVWVSGVRPRLFLGVLPAGAAGALARRVEALLGIPVSPLPNYLPVTLSASNAIFNPARLYGAFACGGDVRPQQFYEDWDDRSSEAYLGLDEDVQRLAAVLPDTSAAVPIKTHFGAEGPAELTARIRSLRPLRHYRLPLRRSGTGWKLDRQSWFVTEDACFSLPVLRSVADAAGVEAPWIDRVLAWVQQQTGTEFVKEGKLIGQSVAELPTCGSAGIENLDALVSAAVE